MLPTWVVSLLQAGRITRYTAIIETPATVMILLASGTFLTGWNGTKNFTFYTCRVTTKAEHSNSSKKVSSRRFFIHCTGYIILYNYQWENLCSQTKD